jgi:SAM-dependent methyltransferase
MQSTSTEFDELKKKMRAMWMAGDFGQIALYSATTAEEFVARLSIQPGVKVLDVACGTGNLSIPAARGGAEVTGLDIAPNLLEQARARAAAEDLHIVFEEGDAEEMSYSDGAFDMVITMFGAMFAPRPDRVAAELSRVCRSGGKIAMANWTREGLVGKMFAAGARFVPPPEGVPPPILWGDESVVKQRLDGSTAEIQTTRREAVLNYSFSPRETVEFFRNYFGPTQVAFSKLDAAGQTAYAAEMERLWREHNEAKDRGTLVRAEYLEVIATRA